MALLSAPKIACAPVAMGVAYKRVYAIKANVQQLKVLRKWHSNIGARKLANHNAQLILSSSAHETLYTCIPHGRRW